MSVIEVDEKIARITDILEQIEQLNKMVNFHKKESGEASMMRQYVEMRKNFLIELQDLLSNFEIEVKIKDVAA
ncbi:MAG: hypothetical protein IPJ74_08220 [Saprospiraceae bacterium]|nr:hypothetical protein [Saprospiraceae bacterium]